MTADTLRDDLQRQIDAGQVVAIVGAGVSVGATNGAAVASWQGLLHDGVDRCRELGGVTETSAKILHDQIDTGDLAMMLAAAEVVSSKLGAPDGGEWRRWLRESVGELRVERRGVIEALRDLGVTLATTNYDGLIEEVTGLQPVTWRAGSIVERVLRGEEEGVLHLHGFWRDPESVVLGVRDYQKVLGDAHAQTMQRAMRSLNTLLFVGCGEGLVDPNFGALLRWSEGVFAGSEYRHFRLARDGEVATLQAGHSAEQRIFVLGYGPGYGDLEAFLRGLRPTARAGAAPVAAAPLPAAAALPPAPLCVGRDDEIADLVATLLADDQEPVPLLGPAGIGKSTITLVALNDPRVAERYGARRYFIRCDAVRTREALAAAVATAAGLPVGPQVEVALLSELASAPAVVAIDNAETPWEADTLRVEELLAQLAALPGLALVASLRGYSRPMGVQWRQPIQPRSLPLEDARKVFLAVTGDQFADDPDLERLLRALDGVPLAISLMASAAEGQPDLADTWARWERERTRMLQRAGGKDRLVNIEVSYELSIQAPRMTEEARRLLSILGFLPGGVARGDVEAVFPSHGTRAATVLRQVSLVLDEAARLRLLAPLREYVNREHPPGPEDLQTTLSHYLELATSLGQKPGREGGAEAVARLTPEIENIETVIAISLDAPGSSPIIEAAISLAQFARFTGLGTTDLLEKAASVAQTRGVDKLAAACLERLGDIAAARSDHESARTHYEEALPLYRRVLDILGEANCILRLGNIAHARSDHDSARERYEEALPLYRRVGDIRGEANCISRLGDIALARSDHESARTRCEEALPLYRRVGVILGEANCIKRLGDIALVRSEHENARTRYEEALPLYRRVGDILGEANCIQGMGEIAFARSDHESARERYEEALPLYRRVGDILGEASCISRLGEIALARSDHESARTRYEEALPLYRRVGAILGAANCILGLGDIDVANADYESARGRYEEALDLYERIRDPYSIGLAHRRLAHVPGDEDRRRGHVNAAKNAWRGIGRDDLVKRMEEEFGTE
ncbi:MAG TPA: tetratricopeptide repeat protein [Longimicrobium sp.]|nr:tetratricopeptide repeat protein [Longimicrobium sp.]